MPGSRPRNVRSGHIHEELGNLLLRRVALVAPVPSTEDVGIDTVATLLRPESSKLLIPEDTFAVQFKASSEKSVKYPDVTAATWLMNLEIPFFIGRVRMKKGSVDLFPTHRLFHVKKSAALRAVYLHLEPHAQCLGAATIAHVELGEPAFSWSIKDLSDKTFQCRIYPVLKAHIESMQRNIRGRPIGYCELMEWATGVIPNPPGAYGMMHGGNGSETADALKAIVAPIRTILAHIAKIRRPALLPTVFEFIKLMRLLGEDPDGGDTLMEMSAIAASGIGQGVPLAE